MKTTTRLIGVVAIAMVLSIAFSGVALACCPVPETVCTSDIATLTQITVFSGTAIEDESLIFSQASVDLNTVPPLHAAELYGNTRYAESMIASNGILNYVKDFDFDNANSGGVPDLNLDVEKSFDFLAYAGGGLVFSETVAVDAISNWQPAAALMCPFAAPGAQVPESCEYVDAGSTLDVTEVSATTHAQTITTAMSSDTTPITVHYDISAGATYLNPNSVGAVGSASAFMTVHDMEGHVVGPALGSEVLYEEETSVSGVFDFSKDMEYVSGILLP